MTEWRVKRADEEFEDALYDVEVVDTANPFGNHGIAFIEDLGGVKFEQYRRGTRLDFEVKGFDEPDTAFETRLTGYVVEPREAERAGADVLEAEVYSFDQFLRRQSVSNDQSGNTIAEALEDIITNDVPPVSWNAELVEVGDEQELSRSLQGKPVEFALGFFRALSENEEFGVTADFEFFFRPREATQAPRGIDNTQWISYDIPERGKEAPNELEVFFDGGDRSVVVDRGDDKLDLQESLDAPGPVEFKERVVFEDITDIEDAEVEGRRILEETADTLAGTVTTYGLLDAEPGDVIDVEIVPRGIDDEFRIAQLEYDWGRDQTTVTLVENRAGADDMLVRMSETVKRTELRPANEDAVRNRVTSTSVAALVDVSGDVDGTAFEDARFTNAARDAVRDGWAGDGTIDITHVAVGDDASGLSRTNTELGNETERITASETLPDATTAEYSATFTETDIREVGLIDASGTDDLLVARATVDDDFDPDPDVTVALAVSDDADVVKGVLTEAGQETTRDILADNDPDLPAQYAYGSDGSEPAETDVALGAQVVVTDLDELLIQAANTDAEWEGLT